MTYTEEQVLCALRKLLAEDLSMRQVNFDPAPIREIYGAVFKEYLINI